MHQKNIIKSGVSLNEASKVLIMVHGRGATAKDILSLADHLDVPDYALLAPQATGYTWYPQSFMAPPAQNEPWLSSALIVLQDVFEEVKRNGFDDNKIYLLGFSQGACLTLEFVTRNARHWGGVVAFTGGLIGDILNTDHYNGNFAGTPVFIGTSDPDPHVPVERVHDTTRILKEMQADVTEVIYENMGHTISQDEINKANELVFNA